MKAAGPTRHRQLAALGIVAAILAIAVPVAVASAPTQVKSANSSKLGTTIIVNAQGHTLYMFSKDHGSSTCSGACEKAWPPLLGGAVVARSGVKSSLLKLTTRSDGNRQATYNNHPLYTFSGDHAAGQTNGEGANAFGGHWYAVNTAGNEVPKLASGY
jgi:predicted lipoprotein with Yx(FWY)xxD motif